MQRGDCVAAKFELIFAAVTRNRWPLAYRPGWWRWWNCVRTNSIWHFLILGYYYLGAIGPLRMGTQSVQSHMYGLRVALLRLALHDLMIQLKRPGQINVQSCSFFFFFSKYSLMWCRNCGHCVNGKRQRTANRSCSCGVCWVFALCAMCVDTRDGERKWNLTMKLLARTQLYNKREWYVCQWVSTLSDWPDLKILIVNNFIRERNFSFIAHRHGCIDRIVFCNSRGCTLHTNLPHIVGDIRDAIDCGLFVLDAWSCRLVANTDILALAIQRKLPRDIHTTYTNVVCIPRVGNRPIQWIIMSTVAQWFAHLLETYVKKATQPPSATQDPGSTQNHYPTT